MLGALFLCLFCGIVARMFVPGDMFRDMNGPVSWLISLGLGLVGALLGYLVFTVGLGIGDTDIFDWGGVLSALIGTIIVLVIATLYSGAPRAARAYIHCHGGRPQAMT